MTRFKICGLTRPADVKTAVAAGAAMVGFVHIPGTRRHVPLDQLAALATLAGPFALRVAVLADPTPESAQALVAAVPLDALQLHGSEPPELVLALRQRLSPAVRLIKAVRVATIEDVRLAERYDPSVDALLVDSGGGTGIPFDWALLQGARTTRPLILAGGLTPGNVAEAIARTHPAVVDVSSGVEASVGLKDPQLIAAFARAVRSTNELAGL